MLTTNMIRKDLNSQNQYDAGVALSALSCFISADLARDLANDIMTLVRKSAYTIRNIAIECNLESTYNRLMFALAYVYKAIPS